MLAGTDAQIVSLSWGVKCIFYTNRNTDTVKLEQNGYLLKEDI